MSKKNGDLTVLEKITQNKPRVEEFLSEVEKNSQATKRIYTVGLASFETFLSSQGYNLETVLEALIKSEIEVYSLCRKFVTFLINNKMSANGIKSYTTAVRSYLIFYDINMQNFKRKVKLPKKTGHKKEQPLTAENIRDILQHCNNRRLKSYLLVVASSGLRATEAIMLRVKDVKLSDNPNIPTMVHVRAENTKTDTERDVFISGEATTYLKEYLRWKYRDRGTNQTPKKSPNDLIFVTKNFGKVMKSSFGVYMKINGEFNKLLETIGMDERKDGMIRRKITLHSFRRYVFTTLSNKAGKSFGEFILGHADSYYTGDETEQIELYKKCEKYLTFLSYKTVEAVGTGFESELHEKELQINQLQEQMQQLQADMQLLTRLNEDKFHESILVNEKLSPEVRKQMMEAQNEILKSRIQEYHKQGKVYSNRIYTEDELLYPEENQ